jgi:hypothetical protein
MIPILNGSLLMEALCGPTNIVQELLVRKIKRLESLLAEIPRKFIWLLMHMDFQLNLI